MRADLAVRRFCFAMQNRQSTAAGSLQKQTLINTYLI